jgi:hypothetical protein
MFSVQTSSSDRNKLFSRPLAHKPNKNSDILLLE